MVRFVTYFVLVAVLFAKAEADPIQIKSTDFQMKSWVTQKDPRGRSKYPLINIRVVYVGDSELRVSPISSGQEIVFGTPNGWKAKRLSGLMAAMGPVQLPRLKKGKFIDATIPLSTRFTQISNGLARVPIRVAVQPFEGEGDAFDMMKNPEKKTSLKALPRIILTGFVTVTILPQQGQPKH